ncbi:Hypothetical protein PENO1_009370 [Penicillium occitanis (nom. inval.)]|nr:Hypothetical protein PENO1_009370 [Penicillium occitanis (nom. inval.)]PCH09904.1 hypothetical protein PENOC_006580 [Penicillium occitanis (nom. inval.)]
MDPVSAISLVSSILTFIDFAHKIVTGVDEIHNSVAGETEENTHTNAIVSDLRDAAADLIALGGRTEHEKELNKLATKCKKVSDNLLHLLTRLTVSGNRSTWKVLKVVIRGLRKDGEVTKMVSQLSEYRSQILVRLNLILNDQQCSVKHQLDRLEDQALNQSTESAARLTKLREDILEGVSQLLTKDYQERTVKSDSEGKDNRAQVQTLLGTLSSMMTTVSKENAILKSIFFPAMNDREENMGSAEDGTFEWIVEEEGVQPSRVEDDESLKEGRSIHNNSHMNDIQRKDWGVKTTARTNFLNWLRFGGGIFHISGKAGSGKSTLMKLLYSNERIRQELQVWAGTRKLIFAHFYFWKSSNILQMSLSGLRRTILFETLKYCPDLIPHLFPSHWKMPSISFPFDTKIFIKDSEIAEAFETLTMKGSFPQHRFCFFVDGLDEYVGNTIEQKGLAKELQRWASGDDVKICASSRPYIQFDKLVPSEDRRIHLHQLTRYDIYVFSRKMIEDTLNDDLEWVKDYYLRLVEKIVDKSEGVFLWARLVVFSLLEGMLRRDTEEVLEAKLDILPRDIYGLYTELLNTLSPDDRLRAEKIMLLAAHDPFQPPLSIVVYAFVDQLNDLEFPPRDGHKPPSWKSFDETTEHVERQLKGLTKGLLETEPITGRFGQVTNRRSVKFFHRTLRDFVLESKLGDTMRQFPSLTEIETYHRLWLAELILMDPPARAKAWREIWSEVVKGGRFQAELTPDLLQRFASIFKDENDIPVTDPDGSSDETSIAGALSQFTGGMSYPEEKASFACLAACNSQQEYILQETTKNPGLLRGNGQCHIMLSAALCGKVDLVQALLHRGSSPMDKVTVRARNGAQVIPVWTAFTTQLVGSCLDRSGVHEAQYKVLELFLEDKQVDASTFTFLVCKAGEPITHFITLKNFIQDVKPNNGNQLLHLLERGNGISLVSGTKWLFSKFTPFFKQIESVVDKETHGYAQLRIDEDSRRDQWWQEVVICGDFRLDGISGRGIKLY